MNEDVAGIVHPVELHELVHQFQGHRSFSGFVDLLAQRVLPEKCRTLAISALLVFDDLALETFDTLKTEDLI